MTDYKKAFVDTAPFIYFIEKDENNPQYYDKVKHFFSNGYETDKKCDLFLTNDKQLRQFKEIKCITVDELE